MSFGIQDLDTPFKRFNALPQMMNYQGTWSPTDDYFRNDLVLSPTDFASYIQISPTSVISGGGDPSLNPTDWFKFGQGAGGVQEIDTDAFIGKSGTTYITIANLGVITPTLSANLNNLGTANAFILETTGILGVTAGPGIGTQLSPLAITDLFNTGVRSIAGQGNIVIADGATPFDKTISYTGVGTLTSPLPGLTVGPGATPLVTNTGLLSVITGTGIINTSTAQTPNLNNDGLITLAGSNSITVNNTAGAVTLSTTHPSISQIGTMAPVMVPSQLTSTVTSGRIAVTQTPATDWATSISTGLPYATGSFELSFSITFLLSGINTDTGNTILSLYDGVNNVLFPLTTSAVSYTNVAYNRSSATTPYSSTFGKFIVDLTAIRASGFKEMTHFQIDQIFVASSPGNTVVLQAASTNIFGVYYTNPIA